MSFLSNLVAKAKELFAPPELLSPLPDGYVPQVRASTGMTQDNKITNQLVKEGALPPEQAEIYPQPNPNGGRNPNWDKWQQLAPKSFEQLLAGAKAASQNTGVPLDLLMDISGAETSGGQFLNQFGGAPGQGYFQFEPSTLDGLGADIDPFSATESAQLAADLIKKKQLSRWGTPGAKWGTLDNPNNSNGRLTDLYSPEELNPYLSPKYQIR